MLRSSSIEVTIAAPDSIDYALESFINEVSEFSNKEMLDMHIYVLNVLREHLDKHGKDFLVGDELYLLEQSKQNFCTVFSAYHIIPNVEKFLRHCLYWEEQTSEYMRHCFITVLIRFFHFLFQSEIISENDYRQFSNIITKLSLLEEQAEHTLVKLTKLLRNKRQTNIKPELYEVTQKLGENLWLKPYNLDESFQKPIKLTRSIVELIEVGWTLECTIESLAGRPIIYTCSKIYPSLSSS